MDIDARTAADATVDPVADAAAGWLARRHEGMDVRAEEAFVTWLAADPAHKRAYDELARAWEALGALSAVPHLCAMRSEALIRNPPRRRYLPFTAAAAATAAAILALVARPMSLPDMLSPLQIGAEAPRELRTARGERLETVLPDGSTVTLNTDTRLRIAFAPHERRIILTSGQAYFQVAKDKARPFVVRAGDSEVVALGTAFEVRYEQHKIAVTLVEGRVKVRRQPDAPPVAPQKVAAVEPEPVALLDPGERLVLDEQGTVSVAAVPARDLTSWREGRIRFDETPLPEAVAEMNRYSDTRIVLADARLADIRVSGVFRPGQSNTFVSALTELFPVRAADQGEQIALHANPPKKNF